MNAGKETIKNGPYIWYESLHESCCLFSPRYTTQTEHSNVPCEGLLCSSACNPSLRAPVNRPVEALTALED